MQFSNRSVKIRSQIIPFIISVVNFRYGVEIQPEDIAIKGFKLKEKSKEMGYIISLALYSVNSLSECAAFAKSVAETMDNNLNKYILFDCYSNCTTTPISGKVTNFITNYLHNI